MYGIDYLLIVCMLVHHGHKSFKGGLHLAAPHYCKCKALLLPNGLDTALHKIYIYNVEYR